MKKADYEKYMTISYSVAEKVQLAELINEICKILGDEEKTAREIFNELKKEKYLYTVVESNSREDLFVPGHGWTHPKEIKEVVYNDDLYKSLVSHLQKECFHSRAIEVEKVYVNEDNPDDKIVFRTKIGAYRVA